MTRFSAKSEKVYFSPFSDLFSEISGKPKFFGKIRPCHFSCIIIPQLVVRNQENRTSGYRDLMRYGLTTNGRTFSEYSSPPTELRIATSSRTASTPWTHETLETLLYSLNSWNSLNSFTHSNFNDSLTLIDWLTRGLTDIQKLSHLSLLWYCSR